MEALLNFSRMGSEPLKSGKRWNLGKGQKKSKKKILLFHADVKPKDFSGERALKGGAKT